MSRKKFPRKPFMYGKYVIEYRDEKGGMLRFLKEHLDTIEEAQAAREKLLATGCYEPTIKIIG